LEFSPNLELSKEQFCRNLYSSQGVRIEVVNGEEPKDVYQELVEDLIALVSSFIR